MIENLLGGGGGGGTVDTVVAGTGISVNSTDPANPIVTLANHDASLITTGTIATARLGTGTANSSTYLAGDQTYKAAVTSVNGSTGAVTVAAGDTTYTVTVTDAENTSSKIDLVSFTVPANTWADGESIWIDMDYEYLNNSGAGRTTTHFASGTGITETSGTQAWLNDVTAYRGFQSWRFVRIGTQALSPNINFAHLMRINTGFPNSQAFAIDTSVDYTTAITLKISLQFPVANASLYLRPLLVRAYKTSAGQQ